MVIVHYMAMIISNETGTGSLWRPGDISGPGIDDYLHSSDVSSGGTGILKYQNR